MDLKDREFDRVLRSLKFITEEGVIVGMASSWIEETLPPAQLLSEEISRTIQLSFYHRHRSESH